MESNSIRYLNYKEGDKYYVRCCLGELDGEWKLININLRIGEYIRFAVQKPISIDYYNNYIPNSIEICLASYKLTQFKFNKDETYLFLVSKNFTDKDAILNLFNRK